MGTNAVRREESSEGEDAECGVVETSFINQQTRGDKGRSQVKKEDLDDTETAETRCGIGGCQPPWLQRFARAEVYAVAYGVLGLAFEANTNYFAGSLSTIEKHLKIPSKTSGFIRSAFEVGAVLALPVMGYAARHVRPMRLLATGAALTSVACLCFALPYAIFGAGADARALAALVAHPTAGNASVEILDAFCNATPTEDCNGNEGIIGDGTLVTSILLFMANLLMGIGNAANFSVGLAYLDNNSPKNMAPILLAATVGIRMLGPTTGFWIAAITLRYYVDPTVTPPFSNSDPRWIGAWWLGLPAMGVLTALVGVLVALFPRRLPRAAARRRELLRAGELQEEPFVEPSLRDLVKTLRRLLSNKVLFYNTCAAVCLGFGYESYVIFKSKYVETVFRQTASQANVITGTVGLVFSGVGMLTASIVITRFKPRPRTLAAWNVLTEVLDILSHVAWAFIGCSQLNLHGGPAVDGNWNLTAACNTDCACGPEVKFAPVCSASTGTTFFSPCHAGCASSLDFGNGTKVFSDCTCVSEGAVVQGPCPTDCAASFTIFIVMRCIATFLQATGRSGNALLAFRCVNERDKTFSIALAEFALCLLAYFPAPTVYGAMLDMACIVWGVTCGETGHCWLYNDNQMRYFLNFTAASSLFIGLIFDVFVWVHCPGLKLYDEDHKIEQDGSAETSSIMAKGTGKKTEEELIGTHPANGMEKESEQR